MPFNGSGTFNPLSAPTFPAVTGAVIFAARFNSNLTDIHQGLSNCLTRDGQSVPTANLPMGGMKLTGLAAGTSPGDSIRYEQYSDLNAAALQMRTEHGTGVNLNTLTSAGVYSTDVLGSCTNIPTHTTAGYFATTGPATITVLRTETGDEISQLLHTGNRLYSRLYSAAAWSAWRDVGNSGSTPGAAIDFNSYTIPGSYSLSSTDMSTSTNRPSEYISSTLTDCTAGGLLSVLVYDEQVVQKFHTSDGREFTRFYVPTTTTWSSWNCKYPVGYAGGFTPSLTAGSGTTGVSYTLRSGHYWRIGPLVFFSAMLWFDHDGTWAEGRLNVPVAPINYITFNNGPVISVSVSRWDTATTHITSALAMFRATTASEALALTWNTIEGHASFGGSSMPTTNIVLTYSGWYVAAANA